MQSQGVILLTAAMGALFWGGTAGAATDTHLRFCYDPYPPYTDIAEDASVQGLKVTLLQEVVARIDGVTAEVVLLPWQRCQVQARSGEVDGILPLFQNAERDSYLAFTDGTYDETSVFWYHRDAYPDGIDWSGDLNELADMQLGMLEGGHIDTAMQDAFTAVRPIERTGAVEGLFYMLLHDRVDLVATDLQVGLHHAETNALSDQIGYVARPITTQVARFGLSRTSGADRYLDQFNAALRTLAAEGEIDRIFGVMDMPDGAAGQ